MAGLVPAISLGKEKAVSSRAGLPILAGVVARLAITNLLESRAAGSISIREFQANATSSTIAGRTENDACRNVLLLLYFAWRLPLAARPKFKRESRARRAPPVRPVLRGLRGLPDRPARPDEARSA